MLQTRINKLATTILNTGEFRVNKSGLYAGIKLGVGDRLPVDSPIRNDSARLETLCRVRMLEPVMVPSQTQETVARATVKSKSPEKQPAMDVDSMSRNEVVKLLRQHKLPANGDISVIRKRLRAKLG